MIHRCTVVTPVKYCLTCLISFFLWNSQALAAGGCGSACIPLEALDVVGSQVNEDSFRMSLSWQYANFDNFREGDNDITNMGG